MDRRGFLSCGLLAPGSVLGVQGVRRSLPVRPWLEWRRLYPHVVLITNRDAPGRHARLIGSLPDLTPVWRGV